MATRGGRGGERIGSRGGDGLGFKEGAELSRPSHQLQEHVAMVDVQPYRKKKNRTHDRTGKWAFGGVGPKIGFGPAARERIRKKRFSKREKKGDNVLQNYFTKI